MMEAMDPDGAWQRNRFLAFDWIVQRAGGEPVRRSHAWDRWDGDYRVEGPTDDGTMVAVFNTNAPADGRVWVAGVEVTGEDKAPLLQRANGMYINDSYWLIMPFKWADPGVTTRYLGERTDEDGTAWEVVELSFESVGLTPQNMYQAFVNPETGLMERWAHFRTPDADPFYADWTDWTSFAGVQLAMNKPWADGGRIFFENVTLGGDVPVDAFATPSAP